LFGVARFAFAPDAIRQPPETSHLVSLSQAYKANPPAISFDGTFAAAPDAQGLREVTK
jgi:hypothetical protein